MRADRRLRPRRKNPHSAGFFSPLDRGSWRKPSPLQAAGTGELRTAAGTRAGEAVSSVQGEGTGAVMKVTPGGLFLRNPDAGGSYLYEARPQFTNQKQWTSSDYLLEQLSLHPATMQKRLGDGFYEQRLVREQLSELTGRTPQGGASDDSIYRNLLTNAVSAAREFDLRPGVALSAEQVSRLTSDIVWLESQAVQLPDGSVETVLVPKVYLAHVGEKALQPGGALVTGAGVTISTTEGIVNRGGIIDGGNGRTLLLAGQDIVNQGGTITGAAVALGAGGDVRNETLAVKQDYASNNTSGSYTSLSNKAAILTAGTLQIQAGRDLADLGGIIQAGAATITAGRDISFNTVQTGSTYHHLVAGYAQNDSSITHQLSQLSTSGDLSMKAGANLNLTGTQVAIGTRGAGAGQLLAGGSINIGSVTNEVNTSLQNDPASKAYDKAVHRNQTVVGAGVASAGDLVLSAGLDSPGDLNLSGSVVAGAGKVVLAASNDVNIKSVTEDHLSDTATRSESRGALKRSSSASTDYSASSQVVGSSVSGDAITVLAGNDVAIGASQLVATNGLVLGAGRDLLITSAESTSTENHTKEEKKSGFSLGATGVGYSKAVQNQASDTTTVTQVGSVISGGTVLATSGRDTLVEASTLVADTDLDVAAGRNLSIVSAENSSSTDSASSSKKSGSIGSSWQPALGTVKTTEDGTSRSITQAGSQVASLGGNVSLQAGERYTQTSSSVLAQAGDIDIQAKDVLVEAGYDTADSTSHSTFSKVALGGTVSVPLVNAVQGIASLASAAKDAGGGRMGALAVMTAASNAADTVQQISQTGLSTGIKVSVSLGSTKSENNVTQASSTAVGSQVLAGGNVSIVATGGDKASNINAIGSDISAGGNTSLRADNEVNLLAAENTFSQHSTNSSSGASIGIGFTFGGAQQGFTLDLAANKAKGRADGDELSYTNTQLSAGGKVTLQSGGDTTLKGGVITAATVQADIGGDLKIESLQDRAMYDSKQTSAGINASLCIPPFCYGASTVGGSVSKSAVNGDFLSVVQQSGIQAGDGGFQLSVGGATDLIGGVISSSQAAIDDKKNSLATGSLTYSSLQNKDVYDAKGFAVSGSVSGNVGNQGSASTEKQQNAAEAGKKAGPSSSGGFGSESGSQRSVTLSGISAGELTITNPGQRAANGNDAPLVGLARDVTTDSAAKDSGALTQRWNGEKLMQQVQAQTEVTQAFSSVAPRRIAQYADSRMVDLSLQAEQESDPTKRAELLSELKKWDEGGGYRTALHTASGALTGGVGGALGAGAVANFANELETFQAQARAAMEQGGMSPALAQAASQALLEGTSAGLGSLVGGTAGAATGLTTDTNNRQLHSSWLDKLTGTDEAEKLKQLQEGKSPDEQQRLADAACFLTHCSIQLSEENPANAAALAQEFRGQDYSKEIDDLRATGLFKYDNVDLAADVASRAGDWVSQEAMAAGRGAVNLGYQILTRGPGGNIQTPPDLPDDTNWPKGATAGSTGAMVPPMVLCGPPPLLVCGMTPPVMTPGTRGYVPSNVLLSGGQGGDEVGGSDKGTGAVDVTGGAKTPDGSKAGGETASSLAKSPVDIAHAIGADYTKAGKPTGGHSLLNGDVRIVPGTESVPDATGVYKATIQVPDPQNPGQWLTKTSNNSTTSMFPKDWDAARIQSEVDAAWNSPKKIINGAKWSSFTPSGVKVEGFISPRTTVFPIHQP